MNKAHPVVSHCDPDSVAASSLIDGGVAMNTEKSITGSIEPDDSTGRVALLRYGRSSNHYARPSKPRFNWSRYALYFALWGPPICFCYFWILNAVSDQIGTPYDQIIEISVFASLVLAFIGPIVLAVIAVYRHPGGNAIENYWMPLAAVVLVIAWPFILYAIEVKFDIIKIVI